LVDNINNNPTATWKAEMNHFADWDEADVRAMLGTVLANPETEPTTEEEEFILKSIPDNFDSAEQWPGCVHPVRNQGQCGSCWAFGATEALSDRFCVASNKSVDVVLSPQDLVSCDKLNMGCNGGMLFTAWEYMKHTGVLEDSCLPYASINGTDPKCPTTCADGTPISSAKRYHVKSFKHVGWWPWGKVAAIQTAIMTGGPVEGAFSVYADFMSYQSGVYQHINGSLLGGHAIKITGWGVDEQQTPYWRVQNSWGPSWGEKGFFNIKRGDNECGIEGTVYAGVPDV